MIFEYNIYVYNIVDMLRVQFTITILVVIMIGIIDCIGLIIANTSLRECLKLSRVYTVDFQMNNKIDHWYLPSSNSTFSYLMEIIPSWHTANTS